MKTTNWILGLTLIVGLSGPSCYGPRIFAQNNAAPGLEQEFFDAIKKGDAGKVGELFKQKPELIKASTKKGITPVLLAVYTNHKEIAESLLAAGLAEGIRPNIFEASALGCNERVRELLKQDPRLVKAFSPDGWTALHLNWGRADIVELLLDNGADIEAVSKNNFKATPLQSAVAGKWIDSARLLINHKANVNCRGDEGFSPLHEAAFGGLVEIAKLLLEHGANVNAKADNGKTPLAVAIESKQAAMEKFLREHNATQ